MLRAQRSHEQRHGIMPDAKSVLKLQFAALTKYRICGKRSTCRAALTSALAGGIAARARSASRSCRTCV